jgi:hypothetical protein
MIVQTRALKTLLSPSLYNLVEEEMRVIVRVSETLSKKIPTKTGTDGYKTGQMGK